MVKKLGIFLILITALILIGYAPKSVIASSFNELIIGTPTDEIGDHIASKTGCKLIEFWHYSGGYWKATSDTGNGLKEIKINDYEATSSNWTDVNFLLSKIYENEFVLEMKVWHPQEVLNALSSGAEITPVLNIDTKVLNLTEEQRTEGNHIPMNYFNFDPLPTGLPSNLPEKPEYAFYDNYIEIYALPKLNCDEQTFQEVVHFYPHCIPLVKPGFGSLSYSLYHHNGSHAGVGYSPDGYYTGLKTIPYSKIQDIQGRLEPGFVVTTSSSPPRKDEESGELRIGYNTFANAGAVSIRFWYPIRIDYYAKKTIEDTPTPTPTSTPTPILTTTPTPTPHEPEDLSEKKESEVIADTTCIIKADTRGNERFDVSKGIPVKENLYVNAVAKEYLHNSTLTEHAYTGKETIRVKKTYNLKWKEDEGHSETTYCGTGTFRHVKGSYCTDSDGDGINDSCPGHKFNGCEDTNGDNISDYCPGHTTWLSNWVDKTDTEVVYSSPHSVERDYSYWTVDNLEVFVPEILTVQNKSLPGGSVSVGASGLTSPEIIHTCSADSSDHVLKDPFSEAKDNGAIIYDSYLKGYIIELGSKELTSETSKPDIPEITDYITIAENAISNYHVKNDSLVFNGKTILDNAVSETGVAKIPESIPEAQMCNSDVFYKNQILIPENVLNGVHNSSGSITYKMLANSVKPVKAETLEADIPSINSVTIHTPVICSSGVFNDRANDQSLVPDESRVAVVLGKPSSIQFLTVGKHLDIPGYNDPATGKMDCAKYTKKMEVMFPFDVYIGTDEPISSYFLPKNTWYTVPFGQDITDLFIPTWVPEGEYDVTFREIAVNAPDTTKSQHLANTDITNYVAERTSIVKVIGRLYGFKITDVTDTLWRDVFRVNGNSSAHTGNYYYVGTKNQNGIERGIASLFTLPLVEGSHSQYKNRGALKTGYTFRFELETTGEYYGDDDCINIIPEFYYVKRDGTGRQKVDLWYHAEFNDKTNYFVLIEPQGRNRDNPLTMKFGTPNRNVPIDEIADTARLIGISESSFKNKTSNIGWFDRIILSKYQRTFIGEKASLPSGVDADTSLMSVQKWYGEYSLPNTLYVTTPGFDVPDYGRTHYGLDGKESFWLKDGYIIVNFRIESIKNNAFDSPSLSYWGAPRCNMFEVEGYEYQKSDYYGATFMLEDGDIVFYDTNKRATDDYGIGGTH